MAIEYKDGRFSATMQYEDLMSEFYFSLDHGDDVRAIHFGTPSEIEEVREKADLQTQIDELRAMIGEKQGPQSSVVDIPTADEIKLYGKP